MAKPKIAITGASGFVGSSFIRMFSMKYDIVALGRKNTHCRTHKIQATDYSPESLRQKFQGCDAVLHLAARRLYDQNGNSFLENVQIDHNIFLAAQKVGIENIVITSSFLLPPVAFTELRLCHGKRRHLRNRTIYTLLQNFNRKSLQNFSIGGA